MAPNEDAVIDEAVIAAHHYYRLAELGRSRWGGYDELDRVPGARGLLWARGIDTHKAVQVVEVQGRYSTYYPAFYGVGVWIETLALESFAPMEAERFPKNRDSYRLYLEGNLVESTLQSIFDATQLLL